MAKLLSDAKTTLDVVSFFNGSDRDIFLSLQDHGLLRRKTYCTKSACRRRMILKSRKEFKGGFAFRCPRCRSLKSAALKTFFDYTTLSFKTIIIILWHFLCQTRYRSTAVLLNLNHTTVIKYYAYFTEICSWKLIQSYQQSFGGPDTVVYIHECCITKRKLHHGRLIPARWVFGIFDCQLNREIAVYVSDRTSEVLIPLICHYVKPGTEIRTDRSPEYSSLGTLGHVSPFIHKTIDYSQNFVDPVTGACRYKFENYWSRLKEFIRRLGVIHSPKLPNYIDYFIWATIYGSGSKAFTAFLDHIKEKHPVK